MNEVTKSRVEGLSAAHMRVDPVSRPLPDSEPPPLPSPRRPAPTYPIHVPDTGVEPPEKPSLQALTHSAPCVVVEA